MGLTYFKILLSVQAAFSKDSSNMRFSLMPCLWLISLLNDPLISFSPWPCIGSYGERNLRLWSFWWCG